MTRNVPVSSKGRATELVIQRSPVQSPGRAIKKISLGQLISDSMSNGHLSLTD